MSGAGKGPYVLRVATVDGRTAPCNGEHVEYADRFVALRDAGVFAMVQGLDVTVVEHATGWVAGRAYANGATAAYGERDA